MAVGNVGIDNIDANIKSKIEISKKILKNRWRKESREDLRIIEEIADQEFESMLKSYLHSRITSAMFVAELERRKSKGDRNIERIKEEISNIESEIISRALDRRKYIGAVDCQEFFEENLGKGTEYCDLQLSLMKEEKRYSRVKKEFEIQNKLELLKGQLEEVREIIEEKVKNSLKEEFEMAREKFRKDLIEKRRDVEDEEEFYFTLKKVTLFNKRKKIDGLKRVLKGIENEVIEDMRKECIGNEYVAKGGKDMEFYLLKVLGQALNCNAKHVRTYELFLRNVEEKKVIESMIDDIEKGHCVFYGASLSFNLKNRVVCRRRKSLLKKRCAEDTMPAQDSSGREERRDDGFHSSNCEDTMPAQDSSGREERRDDGFLFMENPRWELKKSMCYDEFFQECADVPEIASITKNF